MASNVLQLPHGLPEVPVARPGERRPGSLQDPHAPMTLVGRVRRHESRSPQDLPDFLLQPTGEAKIAGLRGVFQRQTILGQRDDQRLVMLVGQWPLVGNEPDALEVEIQQARVASGAHLDELFRAFSVDDWDGYGARAVTRATLERAHTLLRVVPMITTLEIGADPDGEITFEWQRGPRAVLTVSVGEAGPLSYAGLFGPNKVHGAESFIGELPKAIRYNLLRLASEPLE